MWVGMHYGHYLKHSMLIDECVHERIMRIVQSKTAIFALTSERSMTQEAPVQVHMHD